MSKEIQIKVSEVNESSFKLHAKPGTIRPKYIINNLDMFLKDSKVGTGIIGRFLLLIMYWYIKISEWLFKYIPQKSEMFVDLETPSDIVNDLAMRRMKGQEDSRSIKKVIYERIDSLIEEKVDFLNNASIVSTRVLLGNEALISSTNQLRHEAVFGLFHVMRRIAFNMPGYEFIFDMNEELKEELLEIQSEISEV